MSTVLTLGSSTINVPQDVLLGKLVAYHKGSYPSLSFFARGGPLAGLPDPYLGKTVTLSIGGVTYFTGDVVHGPDCSFDPTYGWVRGYQCLGLRNRLDWFPHTSGRAASPRRARIAEAPAGELFAARRRGPRDRQRRGRSSSSTPRPIRPSTATAPRVTISVAMARRRSKPYSGTTVSVRRKRSLIVPAGLPLPASKSIG